MAAPWDRIPLTFGKIVFLNEVQPERDTNSTIRTLGRATQIDLRNRKIIISHNNNALAVDTEYIDEAFCFSLNSLYQFIGDLKKCEESSGQIYLKARVARCIDGMDTNLYEQAVVLMRKSLEKPSK